jgi:hypothetical protein
MTQTVHTPLVSEEISAALNLISCNYTHFVIGCKENATVLKQIFVQFYTFCHVYLLYVILE